MKEYFAIYHEKYGAYITVIIMANSQLEADLKFEGYLKEGGITIEDDDNIRIRPRCIMDIIK